MEIDTGTWQRQNQAALIELHREQSRRNLAAKAAITEGDPS